MTEFVLEQAIDYLAVGSPTPSDRNFQMPGDPHYQPKDLRRYLGYDQRVGWQIIAEWAWLHALARHKVMPDKCAELLTPSVLAQLLANITTTKVTELERDKNVGHDIIALLMLMREHLPTELHPYLHWCATSYDPISTAFALQARQTFLRVVYPKMKEVDEIWRSHIDATAEVLQIGRTHLQDALPITVGAWLAVLHRRFINTAMRTRQAADEIHGKFSGAVGTYNAITAFLPVASLEATVMAMLELPSTELSTQLPLPEGLERFYHEMTLHSAALANLGEDVRHLQSSAIGEIKSASSTSSTMSHKTANPIAAESLAGMHVSVRAEYMKVLETVNSDLQRDLRYSNVMRGYSAVTVFTYQQLLTAQRLFKSFAVDEQRCRENFDRNGKLVTAELLHLSLQRGGYKGAHELVNKTIVPAARKFGSHLVVEMDEYVKKPGNEEIRSVWAGVPPEIRHLIAHPEEYLGMAVQIARAESINRLE